MEIWGFTWHKNDADVSPCGPIETWLASNQEDWYGSRSKYGVTVTPIYWPGIAERPLNELNPTADELTCLEAFLENARKGITIQKVYT